jgi:hypothetical protein
MTEGSQERRLGNACQVGHEKSLMCRPGMFDFEVAWADGALVSGKPLIRVGDVATGSA